MHQTQRISNGVVEFDAEYLQYFDISDGTPDDVCPWGTQDSDWEQSLPCWFTCLLEDYSFSLSPTRESESESKVEDRFARFIRPRVDAILHYALARAKKEAQNSGSINEDTKLGSSLRSADVTARLEATSWDYQREIVLPRTVANNRGVLDCLADYVLWYGDRCKLETNLVVLRARKPIGDWLDGVAHGDVLNTMSLIQHNRTTTGGHDETYGILTDGSRWVFLHLSSLDAISSRVLDWTRSHGSAIVCQICRILNKTLTLKLLLGEDGWEEGLRYSSEWNTTMDRQWDSESEDETINSDMLFVFLEVILNTKDNSHADPYPGAMQFIDKVAARLRDLRQSLRDPKQRNKVDNILALTRMEIRQQEAKEKTELPTVAVIDIEPLEVEKTFGVRIITEKDPSWALGSAERRPVPDCLRQMLNNYAIAFGDEGGSEAAIRARLDAILLTVLAEKRREELGQFGEEKGKGKRSSTQSAISVNSLHWGYTQSLKLPCMYRSERSLITAGAAYVLWYGNHHNAETNMAVVEAKELGSVDPYPALCYIGMIHKARKQAGRANYPLFAIATDSYDWRFIRVEPNGKVFLRHYSFLGGEQVEVISHLHRIMAGLSGTVNSQHPYTLSMLSLFTSLLEKRQQKPNMSDNDGDSQWQQVYHYSDHLGHPVVLEEYVQPDWDPEPIHRVPIQVYSTAPLDQDHDKLCDYLLNSFNDEEMIPSFEVYSYCPPDSFACIEHQRCEIAYRKQQH
ncbi:hypothetical protein BJX76DRAFT_362344 [Aspergillus varians]